MYKHNIDSIECKALDLIAGFEDIDTVPFMDFSEKDIVERDQLEVEQEEKQKKIERGEIRG